MKNKKIFVWVPIIFVIVLLCTAVGYKFIKHEQNQNDRINQLQGELSFLKSEFKEYTDPTKVEYSDSAYNYLAIGNSITKHGLAEYWWNEIGMAASSEENDYFHIVSANLEKQYGEICSYAFNFYTWEAQSTDRAETLDLINGYLDSRLDLVTIQLSENVRDLSTYEKDYEELIRYIQNKAPKAQIIVVDDFWDDGEKAELKEEAANNTGVLFVNLDEIKGNKEYQCGMGTTVYDAMGNEHKVEHEGVAGHPGDKGMKYIADEIISVIKE